MKAILSLLSVFVFCLTANSQVITSQHMPKHNEAAYRKPLAAELSHMNNAEDRKELPHLLKAKSAHTPKNTNVIKQQMDSMLIEVQPPSKTMFLENDEKIFFLYDVNGIQTSELYFRWNQDMAVWDSNYKGEYTYNTAGEISQIIRYDWDFTSQQWENNWKIELSYDANDNLIMGTSYYAGGIPGQWIPDYKSEYTYNAADLLVNEVESTYNPDSANWDLDFLYTTSYNANGTIDMETDSIWDASNNQWEPYYRYAYSYNAAWQRIQQEEFDWNPDIWEWVSVFKYEFTYDIDGYMDQAHMYYWNATTSQWDLNYKNDYTWGFLGNMTEVYGYYWDTFSNSWQDSFKNQQSFNMAFSFAELILPIGFPDAEFPSANMMTQQHSFSFYGGSWHDDQQNTYYYNQVTITGIENVAQNTILVYPNPAKSLVVFSWDTGQTSQELKLFDCAGRQVLNQTIQNHTNIDLSQLSNGLYFYKLTDGTNGLTSGKISLQK